MRSSSFPHAFVVARRLLSSREPSSRAKVPEHAHRMNDVPWLPWLLLGGTVAVGICFLRRAPALTRGVLGGIMGAFFGFSLANIPEDPAVGTTYMRIGLVVLGVIGLAFIPVPRPNSSSSRRAAHWPPLLSPPGSHGV
jgi:hypothetical protein